MKNLLDAKSIELKSVYDNPLYIPSFPFPSFSFASPFFPIFYSLIYPSQNPATGSQDRCELLEPCSTNRDGSLCRWQRFGLKCNKHRYFY